MESWLRTEVATTYDAMKADPDSALEAPDVFAELRARHQAKSREQRRRNAAFYCLGFSVTSERSHRRGDARKGLRIVGFECESRSDSKWLEKLLYS